MSNTEEAYNAVVDAQRAWVEIANSVDKARLEFERFVGELALANKAWDDCIEALRNAADDER